MENENRLLQEKISNLEKDIELKDSNYSDIESEYSDLEDKYSSLSDENHRLRMKKKKKDETLHDEYKRIELERLFNTYDLEHLSKL